MRMNLGGQNAKVSILDKSLQRSARWCFIAFMTTGEASPKFFLQLPNAYRHVIYHHAYAAF